ncbi:hypothetical protein LWI29_030471 [Acer saccharum]|uniref:Protein kinase domain-containing protein n=1 Tax=Acer saccharum TaxID=4024 RepID=A0AA39W7C7_ACESA|nr:hypothetical protein LWI29_030471 [Acer saccharum]
MLDENYNAKLSNLGLAILGPSSEEASVPAVIAGTIGYIAPECIRAGYLFLKSDVYGFGAVLLELLMGLRVTDPEHPCGEQKLVDWLKPILSQETKLKTIMDAQMEDQYPSEAALQAAQLSLRCLELDPRSRPSMKEVMEVLKEIEALASHLHENESNLFAGLLPSSIAFHGGYPTRNAVRGGSDQLQSSLAFHGTGYLAGNAVSGNSDQFTPSMAICDVGYVAGNSVSNGCEQFDYGFFCPPHADFPPLHG